MLKEAYFHPISYLIYKLFDENKSPVDQRQIWSNKKLNKFIKSHVTSRMIVLEFGSGGSTLFFSDNCKWVDSVEESGEWKKIVKKKLKRKNVSFFNPKRLPTGKYDVVLVDGGNRKKYSLLTKSFVKKNGIVIFDNLERADELKYFNNIKKKFKKYKIFSGFTVGKAGYTSTGILFN